MRVEYTAPIRTWVDPSNPNVRWEYYVELPDARFIVIRNWMATDISLAFYSYLKEKMAWGVNTIKYSGKEIPSPRLMHFMADVSQHYYSGVSHDCSPWDTHCDRTRQDLVRQFNIQFNAALLNYYRNGKDYIAEHSDKEVEPPDFTVAGLSLGTTRRFYLKSKHNQGTMKMELNSGDLMIMDGRLQELYTHTVPKQSLKTPGDQGRISITFRRLIQH